MTILDKLSLLPPFTCRLLARRWDGRKWRGMSHRDLEQKSGLPKSTISELSYRKNWKGVTVETMQSFSTACGVNHLAARRQLYYLGNRRMTYTETGPRSQVLMYTKLLRLYAAFKAAPVSK